MKFLARHSDIKDPESVKREIAKRKVTNGTKEKLCHAYDRFCRFQNIEWDKPRYQRVEKIPYVPSEKDSDQLILVEFEEDDTYIVKVVSTLDEYMKLLELGYNYVSDYGEKKILRKRK